jgi:hypothetical protein
MSRTVWPSSVTFLDFWGNCSAHLLSLGLISLIFVMTFARLHTDISQKRILCIVTTEGTTGPINSVDKMFLHQLSHVSACPTWNYSLNLDLNLTNTCYALCICDLYVFWGYKGLIFLLYSVQYLTGEEKHMSDQCSLRFFKIFCYFCHTVLFNTELRNRSVLRFAIVLQ